jgi:hypothetical protein
MIIGGGQLPIEKLIVLPYWDRGKIVASVRYWDKAGTVGEDAAFTAGVSWTNASHGPVAGSTTRLMPQRGRSTSS